MSGPSGLIVLDKPTGPTSHDAVNRVRRVMGTRKAGHGGTLDPLATGVLVIGMGRATRILHFLQPLPKVYRAEIRFGITTSTQDSAGEVVEERPCSFHRSDLEREAKVFVGEIYQTPPMYSALKVGGEPLYKAARRGEVVERSPRKVHVHELVVEDFSPESSSARIFARVSGGTYIRTIAADLGERLGCGGHLTALRRLAAGSFTEDEAVGLVDLQRMDPAQAAGVVRPMSEAMRDFPSVTVEDAGEAAVRHGRPLLGYAEQTAAGVPVGVLDASGNLLAVYRRSGAELKAAAVLVGEEVCG